MVHADVDPDDRYEGSSRFSVLFVGRLDANKGVHDLLEAVSTLVDRGVDIECIVVGERERWYEWPERVQTFVELSDHLDFRGFVSEGELAATYAEADVLVLPSEYETFGQVIVEALRSGTPVVATPVGIAPERIVDGVNGAVYDPADPENLVEALSRVRTADRRTLRAESVRSVVDLTWTGLVECLEELYAR
jgi:glycosyltransferase involved in cell wall biosynthesis